MSRPYPQNGTSNQSPFNRQFQKSPANSNTPSPAGGPPTSFKTNVNRAKTKRWVEAKSYSYDGDDWGDVDDYDEYGGYDEPAPQTKPTGLRQQGQTASSSTGGNYDLGGRSNSFNRGDERRDFSAGAPQFSDQDTIDGPQSQLISQQGRTPANPIVQERYSQEQPQYQESYQSGPPASSIGGRPSMDVQSAAPGKANQLPSSNYRGGLYSEQPRQPGPSARSQSITSSNSSVDFHSRRDFSPSAMPSPLSTRGSPAPRSSGDFIPPPRKSSLSQQGPPVSADPDEATSEIPSLTDANPSKPLPFVRPADIYRRMQEEQARQSQPQESPKPNVDAVVSGQAADGSDDRLGERSNIESSRGLPSRPRTSFDTDDEVGGRRLKPSLDPVAERKSEYGIEGLNDRQLLPDVTRVSGFGESFLGSLGQDVGHTLLQTSNASADGQHPSGAALKHHPSQGFRSVVSQAFDRSDEVPQTPSSVSGSAMVRTNSESTNALSPIISRAPSAVKPDVKVPEAETREENITRITEESGEGVSRPTSSDAPGTPKAVARKAPPTQSSRSGSSSSIPTFIPGHRRDISTPSPENSPARTPTVDANRHIHHPQEVEIAMTTPTEPKMPDNDLSTYYEPDTTRTVADTTTMFPSNLQSSKLNEISTNALPTGNADMGNTTHLGSPMGTDSSSKSRVRDLAGKFDVVSSNRRGSEQSLFMQNNVPAQITPKLEDPYLSRPGNDRLPSFRPHLPGGWESSASIPPARQDIPIEVSNLDEVAALPEVGVNHNVPVEAPRTEVDPSVDIDASLITVKTTPSGSLEKEITENPFLAMTAAGAALAGAFATAVGMNHTKASPDPEGFNAVRDRSASTKDREIHPGASKVWTGPASDSESSIVPTPLADDNPHISDQSPVSNSDYFPPVGPLKQKPRNIITDHNQSTPQIRPQILPSLSTDPSPHDYESDRLRKELVRELSPHAESQEKDDGATHSVSAASAERLAVNTSSRNQAHDSIGLPREYESYWNGSASEDDSSRPTSGQQEPSIVSRGLEQTANESASFAFAERYGTNERASDSSTALQKRPAELTHRFSWEQEPEQVNAVQTSPNVDSPPGTQSEYQLSHILQSLPSQAAQSVGIPAATKDIPLEAVETDGAYDGDIGDFGSLRYPKTRPGNFEASSVEPHLGVSKDRLSGSTQQPQQDENTEEHNKALNDVDEPDLPLPPLPIEQPRIPPFREISALKESSDRIKTYDATRQQFADMNTGLAHWIAATINDLPEHSTLLNNGGLFATGTSSHRPSPSRGKLAGLRLSSHVQPSQQPYYQQYLNASSQPVTSSPNSTGQTLTGNGPASNYSSSVAAGSRHQVQAKGKDLLHSAGKFGGKANVAAKGLFSKSKSRLRGVGGADKASIWSSTRTDSSRRGLQHESKHLPQSEVESHATTSTSSLDKAIPSTTYATSRRPISSTPSEGVDTLMQNEYSSAQPSELDGNPGEGGDIIKNQPNPPEQEAKTRNLPKIPDDPASTNNMSEPSPVMTEDGTPMFLKHTPAVQSYEESPRALQSPVSTTSSNQTPTQATFAKSQWLNEIMPASNTQHQQHEQPLGLPDSEQEDHPAQNMLSSMKSILHEENLGDPLELQHELEAPSSCNTDRIGEEKRMQNPSPDRASLRKADGETQLKENTNHRKIPDIASSPRASEDSGGTYETADSGEQSGPRDSQQMNAANSRPILSAPEDYPVSDNSDRQSTPSKISHHQSGNQSDRLLTPNRGRPFSFAEYNKGHSAKPSEDVSYRSSIDTPLQEYQGRPPSPVSPQRSDIIQSTQEKPVHHGINHDFSESDDQGSSKQSRPRSFSRPFQDPDLQNHPAFRHEDGETGSTDLPSQYYPAQLSRNETMLARQQNTEYQVEGIGPPQVGDLTATTRSRRGSRSSAFFKRLSGPPKSEVPPLPTDTEQQSVPATNPSGAQVGKKARRASLFRTLTGRTDSDSGRSKERIPSAPSRSQTDPYQPKISHSSNPKAGVSTKNEIPTNTRNKLQRSSTSGAIGQDGAKKKRFSGIGSIFGRSKQRQSSVPMPVPQSAQSGSHWQQSGPHVQQRPTQGFDERSPPLRQDSAYHANRQATSIPPTTYSQPPSVPKYTQPPLEGYYSPDRTSGSFSQGFISGQRSPRLAPLQDVGVPSHSQHYYSPSQQRGLPPWQSEESSWNLNNQPTPTHYPESTSSFSYPNHANTPNPPPTHRDNDGFSHTRGVSSIGISSNTDSSWIRSPDRHSAANPTTSSQSPLSSSSSPAPHRTSRGPLKSSMKKPRGYHEVDADPISRFESPPPPPPPPKDEWLTKHTQSTLPSHSRASSFNPFPRRSEDSPSRSTATQNRQSLPALQTNMPPTIPTQKSTFGSGSGNGSASATAITPEEIRKARQRQIELGGISSSPRVRNSNDASASTSERGGGYDGSAKMRTGTGTGIEEHGIGTQNEDERIVMSSSSYPGMEWQPEGGYSAWESGGR